MPNKFFQKTANLDIKALVAESSVAALIDHKGVRGTLREYGLGKVLSKYLPFGWQIGSGVIQNNENRVSRETDLVIYQTFILPSIMYGETLGVFPLESCLYALEVKSKATRKEIRTTVEKFNQLKTVQNTNSYFHHMHRVFFAYSSDIKGDELKRFESLDPHFYDDPAIRVICIIGKGYWFYAGHETDENGSRYGTWNYWPANDEHEEVLTYLGGTVNTVCPCVAVDYNDGTRAYKSVFGRYILDDAVFEKISKRIN